MMIAQPGFLTSSLYVVLGGGLGAWLRFVMGRIVPASHFPAATLLVNLLGSLAMGALAAWLARQNGAGESWRLLLGTGMLGGFTTFSTFSLDIVTLAQRGAVGMAIVYAGLSVFAGIVALLLGMKAFG